MMNLALMLGKQKWRSCSSQPTPRATKLLAPKPPSLFAEPQEKNPSMHHLLHYDIQYPSNAILLLLIEILIYNIFPRTWSFMSLLLFSTQLRVVTWFLGMMPPTSWFLTQSLQPLVFSSCGSASTLQHLLPLLSPLVYFINKE